MEGAAALVLLMPLADGLLVLVVVMVVAMIAAVVVVAAVTPEQDWYIPPVLPRLSFLFDLVMKTTICSYLSIN